MNFGIENDFSTEEFAAIGKLVWSFTVLEHELARAAMHLRVATALANNSGPVDESIKKIAKGNMKGRFDAFIAAFQAANPSSENAAWINEAKIKFPDGQHWRDTVCHGNWKRWDDGRLAVRFVDRQSLEDEIGVDY